MARLYSAAHQLWTDVRGQDMVEYALMTGFVATVAAAFLPTTIASSLSAVFSKVTSSLSGN